MGFLREILPLFWLVPSTLTVPPSAANRGRLSAQCLLLVTISTLGQTTFFYHPVFGGYPSPFHPGGFGRAALLFWRLILPSFDLLVRPFPVFFFASSGNVFPLFPGFRKLAFCQIPVQYIPGFAPSPFSPLGFRRLARSNLTFPPPLPRPNPLMGAVAKLRTHFFLAILTHNIPLHQPGC